MHFYSKDKNLFLSLTRNLILFHNPHKRKEYCHLNIKKKNDKSFIGKNLFDWKPFEAVYSLQKLVKIDRYLYKLNKVQRFRFLKHLANIDVNRCHSYRHIDYFSFPFPRFFFFLHDRSII